MRQQNLSKGIALAPILFIVAILGVLVAALAAGNAGFNSNTATETDKTRGGTLVQQGVTLKQAIENIFVNGTPEEQIIIATDYTDANKTKALYAPAGGAILKQIPPRDAVASGAFWAIADNANMEGIGQSGGNDVVAYVNVSNAKLCRAINEIIFGRGSALATSLPAITVTVVANDVTTQDGVIDTSNVFETSGVTALAGYLQACVMDSQSTPNYWYYQVMKVN